MTYILEHKEEAQRLELQKEIKAYSISTELFNVDINNKVILDAGCGGGDVSDYLISESRGSEIHGCDQSDLRVAHAKKKNRLGKFFTSPLENIEAKDNSYDLVICRYVFEYLQNPTAVLREFKRVCKKDGEIIVIDLDGVFKNLYTPNEKFNSDLSSLISKLDVDLDVGRKLSSYFYNAEVEITDVKMEAFYFQDDELSLEKNNSKMRLNANKQDLYKYFGKTKGDEFIHNYLLLMDHHGSSMFFNKFIVKGRG